MLELWIKHDEGEEQLARTLVLVLKQHLECEGIRATTSPPPRDFVPVRKALRKQTVGVKIAQ